MEFFLIGEKLSHSYSKELHARLADYSYQLCPLAPNELEAFLRGRNFAGINVTIPYKKAALTFTDQCSEDAKAIGCVNTIVNKNGRLCGYNTDIDGFLYMADSAGVRFENRKVIILGGGGTGLTASHGATLRGASSVVKISRQGADNYENIARHFDAEIIVNTTPVGMYPNCGASLINLADFPRCAGVLDVIYNPLRTPLVLAAKKRGIPASGGLPMLVAQAAVASELFTGEGGKIEMVPEILSSFSRKIENIVLVGMPGCGKTSIALVLSHLSGREMVDTDLEIERQYGDISEIIKKKGESYFRALEKETVRRVSGRSGIVIATGGGAVLDPENRTALTENGRVYFVERETGQLARTGRPLSNELEQLYKKRLPLYNECADVRIKNDGIERAAAKIWEDFK